MKDITALLIGLLGIGAGHLFYMNVVDDFVPNRGLGYVAWSLMLIGFGFSFLAIYVLTIYRRFE